VSCTRPPISNAKSVLQKWLTFSALAGKVNVACQTSSCAVPDTRCNGSAWKNPGDPPHSSYMKTPAPVKPDPDWAWSGVGPTPVWSVRCAVMVIVPGGLPLDILTIEG
jgi:hypothetical protein